MFKSKKNEGKLICAYSQKPCMGEGCHKWILVQGKDPQSGADVNMYDCADRWMPTFTLDLTRKIHSLGAAVESLRNENKTSLVHLIQSVQNAAEQAKELRLMDAANRPLRVINP